METVNWSQVDAEQLQPYQPIFIVRIDQLRPVTARGDVTNRTCILYSQGTSQYYLALGRKAAQLKTEITPAMDAQGTTG